MSVFDIFGNKIIAGGVVSGERHYNTFSVLSDSYGAFSGFTDPIDNEPYYPKDGNDVTSVRQMWWHKFAVSYGSTLQLNNSFSGSRITNDPEWWGGVENSFISRATNLGKPELILILGGTNDAWNGIPLGEYQYSDWTEEDLQSYRPGLAYMLNYLQEHNPGARIMFIVNQVALTTETGFYESTKTVCAHYGVDTVDVHPDIQGLHPSPHGAAQIRDAIMDALGCEPTVMAKIVPTDATFPHRIDNNPSNGSKWAISEPLVKRKRYRVEIEASDYSSPNTYVCVSTYGAQAGKLVGFENNPGERYLSAIVEAPSYADGATTIGVFTNKGTESTNQTATIESVTISEITYEI